MRVMVDAHMLGSRETGNETYVRNLLVGLAEQGSCDVAAAVPPGVDLSHFSIDPTVERLPLAPPGDWFRLLYTLPSLCRRWRADLLHVTYVGPFFPPCPLIVSVHDVSFRRYPEFFSGMHRLLFSTLLPWTLRRANGVITLSESAKQEILWFYPFLENKVYVTPLAPSRLFCPVTDQDALRAACARYGIHSDFVLAVGNLQPRKNLSRLIEAFAAVLPQVESLQLVIVGQEQWQSSALYDMVHRLDLAERVLFTGYVPDQDLVLLYNAAEVFVYPSVYEGFGLPILEAMACGTPVVTSNTSSMPEVAGDAAILVDPYSVEQIAKGILSVLTDFELRQDLIERSLKRAVQFSWGKTAQQTLEIYCQVLNA